MTYNPKQLSVLAYANGFTLWHYAITDAATVVHKAGFFNAAADMLRVGDMILATGAAMEAGIFVVRFVQNGAVEICSVVQKW